MSIVNLIKRLFENYYGGKIIRGSMGKALMLLVYKKRNTRIYLVPVLHIKLRLDPFLELFACFRYFIVTKEIFWLLAVSVAVNFIFVFGFCFGNFRVKFPFLSVLAV
jgi:hypothetical protein